MIVLHMFESDVLSFKANSIMLESPKLISTRRKPIERVKYTKMLILLPERGRNNYT